MDGSLLLDWLTVDDPMKNYRRYSEDFDASIYDLYGFFNLISATLLFHSCFVNDSLMILWRDIFEALIISMETFLIFIVFVVWTPESLMLHCLFIDESLMILWRNNDYTGKIWIQTLKIIEVSNVIFIRTWTVLCCLID